ncbi:hypothetical protein [Pelosinus sp. UFO1]|uniref:hypothetical protein n=1 Tax=Pelosinus sp. UFO1 TaxID=484770 RepID=UPI0004D103C9|nr:hypothetical protein [Pelosinus sp. UFO1]AIF52816.1 hypothetical protein UFO1_3273 [Pelosinus sp. UFO1]
MKRIVMLILTISVLMMMSVTASAAHGHKDRGNHDNGWHRTHHNDVEAERGLPFAWHERYDSMRGNYHLERVYDRDMDDRFPGLRAYRWSGHEGFWHHGHYVKDAVFFFNTNDEIVSVGYMADGVFISFRENHESYENHDSFYFSWFHRS